MIDVCSIGRAARRAMLIRKAALRGQVGLVDRRYAGTTITNSKARQLADWNGSPNRPVELD